MSVIAEAPTSSLKPAIRYGSASRIAASTGPVTGIEVRRLPKKSLPRGYVRLRASRGSIRRRTCRLPTSLVLATARSTRPCRRRACDELLLPAGPFEVRHQSYVGSALGEEREDVLQRHRLLSQLFARVPEDERLVGSPEDVELDQLDAQLQRRLDGLDGVRRSEGGRAPMADPERRPVATQEVQGAVGSRLSSSLPPRAAYSRIMRSVIHSTGA